MSKFYDKLKKYEEALEQESLRVAESIERAGSEITESIDAHLTLEGRKEEYEAFFMKKLEKYGVSSPAELDEKDKKKFFNEIDSEYTGELDEMMMKKYQEMMMKKFDEKVVVPQFKSDDDRETSEPVSDKSGVDTQGEIDQEVIDGYDADKDEEMKGEEVDHEETPEPVAEEEVEEGAHDDVEEGAHDEVEEEVEGDKAPGSDDVPGEEVPAEEVPGDEVEGEIVNDDAHGDKVDEEEVEEGMHEPKEEGYHDKKEEVDHEETPEPVAEEDDMEEGMHEPKEEGYHDKNEGAHEDEVAEEEEVEEELQEPEVHDMTDVEVTDAETGAKITDVSDLIKQLAAKV